MNSKTYVIIALIVVLAVGFWWMQSSEVEAPTGGTSPTEQSANTNGTQSPEQELDSIEVGADVESEFKTADSDLSTL